MISRRQFSQLALASAAAPALFAKPNSLVSGVQLGAQSYSFRDRPLDAAIEAMEKIGISSCEMYQGHVEPKVSREELRKWRLSVPMSELKAVRGKFDRAGIRLYAYNISFRDDFTDEEISRGFEMAEALGVRVITASSNTGTVKRIDAPAAKAKITVGFHNHSNIKPEEFATPENFADAMKGSKGYIGINLDIGHFTAANFDAVDFLSKNAKHIVTLHIKDRKKNQGPNVPFGEGDTPIKQVLQLMKKMKLKMPANIEYEYKGADTVAEVQKCLDYCRAALQS